MNNVSKPKKVVLKGKSKEVVNPTVRIKSGIRAGIWAWIWQTR